MTQATLERLDLLCDLERWPEASVLLGELLSTDPENDTAWCLLARCRIGLGQLEPALDAARQAAALAPETEWPHRLASFAASTLGRHDDAVHSAREAVRLEPDLWQTHARLAGAAGQHPQGKREAAGAAARALELAPDEAQVQLIYGSVAASQGHRDVAERAYRTALELDPQNSSAHHLLAALQLRRRSGPTALASAATGFATALRSDPRAQVSRHSLELTLRVFLGRTAYFLFITGYLGQLFSDRPSLSARAVPVLLLALPVLFIVGFLHQLTPSLRRFLFQRLRGRGTALAVGLEAASVVLVLIAAGAAQSWRPTLTVLAALSALAARLTLYLDDRRMLKR
jgi:tetratricopeptide (TPR) repeat protein